MAKIATVHELVVWQKAMDLAEQVYREVRHFPSDERFGLVRQLQRASASVPANIAEGFSRRSRAAYRFHVAIGLGSQAELQTHLELAKRLSFIAIDRFEALLELTNEVGRLLHGLWRALSPVTLCYSWVLFVLYLGPGPGALGLPHGFSLFPKP